MIEVKIPFKTPTVNHLYFNWKGRMIKTKEAKLLKQRIEAICSDFRESKEIEELKDIPLRINIKVHENWLCKDGRVKKKDIANREKFLVDAIFDGLGLEDKFIFQHSMDKVQDEEEEFSVVVIESGDL